MRRQTGAALLWLSFLWVVFCGCNKTILDDLETYGKAAPAVNQQLKGVVNEFRKVRHIEELALLRKHLRSAVLPKIKRYVQQLSAIRLRHKALQVVHTRFVKANLDWYNSLRSFEKRATNDTRHIQLLHPLEKQAKRYFLEMKKYKRSMALIYQSARNLP